jgi:hypothetical protein
MPGTAYKVAYVEVSLLNAEPQPQEKLQVATSYARLSNNGTE